MSNKGNTADRVREIVKPITDGLGLVLWDVRYQKEGASWFLRIFIDKDGGVTLDDCEAVSRAVDEPLDDIITSDMAYYLEVSSPGLGRELVKDEHFQKYIGQSIRIRMIRPRDGIKEFIGNLKSYINKTIVIKDNGNEHIFEKSEIAKVILNDNIY